MENTKKLLCVGCGIRGLQLDAPEQKQNEREKGRIKIVSSCAASASAEAMKKIERRVADSSNNNGTLQMYSAACHIQNTLATRRQNVFYAWINFVYLWWLWFRLPTFGGVGRSRWCRCSHSLQVNNSASCTIVPPIFGNLLSFLLYSIFHLILGAQNSTVRSSLPRCIGIAIGTASIANETFYIYEFGILHSDFYHLNSCDLFFGFRSASSSRCANRRYRFFCVPIQKQDCSVANGRKAKEHLDTGIYGSFYFQRRFFFMFRSRRICVHRFRWCGLNFYVGIFHSSPKMEQKSNICFHFLHAYKLR